MVVKEIQYGPRCKIQILDDACKNNTPEDNQRIIDQLGDLIAGCLQRQAYEREKQHKRE